MPSCQHCKECIITALIENYVISTWFSCCYTQDSNQLLWSQISGSLECLPRMKLLCKSHLKRQNLAKPFQISIIIRLNFYIRYAVLARKLFWMSTKQELFSKKMFEARTSTLAADDWNGKKKVFAFQFGRQGELSMWPRFWLPIWNVCNTARRME